MSTADDPYGLPADELADARGGRESPSAWRARLRAQGQENRRLRAELAAARDAAGQRPPAPADPVEEQPDEAAQRVRLEELQRELAAAEEQERERVAAFWESAGMPGRADPPPGAIPPEAIRAAALDRAASEGAQPPTEGLEGMYQRLLDKSVSWPRLQAEMQALGFVDR